MTETIRLGIIDDQVLFRKALSGILNYHKKINIILEESSGLALFKYCMP